MRLIRRLILSTAVVLIVWIYYHQLGVISNMPGPKALLPKVLLFTFSVSVLFNAGLILSQYIDPHKRFQRRIVMIVMAYPTWRLCRELYSQIIHKQFGSAAEILELLIIFWACLAYAFVYYFLISKESFRQY